MDFQEFMSEVTKHGVANTNRFLLEVTGPIPYNKKYEKLLSADDITNGPRALALYCDASELPNKVMTTFETSFRKMPYDQIYDPITINFKVSRNGREKIILDLWALEVIDPLSDYARYQDDYSRNVVISLLNDQNEKVYSIVLVDAYPSTIGSVGLATTEQNNIALATYTFTYRYWEPLLDFNEAGGESTSLFGQIKQAGSAIIQAIRTGDVSSVQGPINDVLKTTKGLLDLDQGETLNYYTKLSEITKTYTGVGLNEGKRFVEGVKRDIDSIEDADVLSGGNKAILSGAAADISGILG